MPKHDFQRAQIARDVYEATLRGTVDKDIGLFHVAEDLAYLMGAILTGGLMELRTRPDGGLIPILSEILANELGGQHQCWESIQVIE